MPQEQQQDLSQYYDALRNADAAGDHAAASKLADYIAAQQGQQQQQGQPAQPSATPEQKPNATQRFKDLLASESPIVKLHALEQPSAKPTFESAASSIGLSGAVGGTMGAIAPEVLMGAGALASLVPGGAAVGVPLAEMGASMRTARVANAAAGFLAGLTSEGAGQAAEAAGANKGQAAGARLAGGLVAPAAQSIAGFVSKTAKTAWSVVQGLAGADSSSVPKAVAAAKENLAKLAEAGQPQTAVHAMLQKGVQADQQAAEAAARDTMTRAHAEAARVAATDEAGARRIVDDARMRADALRAEAAQRARVLEKASGNKLQTANRVLAQAEPELAKVGTGRELSDIGEDLRQAALKQQGAQVDARRQAYQATVAERDAVVKGKEAAGQTLDQLPSMRAFKDELASYTLGTPGGRKAAGGMAKVTDPGVLRGYQQVYDSIINRRVPNGFDVETGQPTYQTFKTSFEALDHVRRRLGDVAAGRDSEGYTAIGKQAAKKMYERISKIQEDFAGPVQRKLQTDYAEGTEGLQKFGSKAGQKLTAVDRLDPQSFMGDAKKLPGHFFSSQQGMRDAIELTGNAGLVHQAARSYTSRSLDGMDSGQVRKWARDNSDWMRESPGLVKDVQGYAGKLEQIERINAAMVKRAGAKSKEALAVRDAGEKIATGELEGGIGRAKLVAEGSVKTQQRMAESAEKQGQSVRESVGGPADRLSKTLQSGEAPEAVRTLLLEGKPEQTRLAAQYLAKTPGGAQVLEQSVRQTLRNMGEKQLRQKWTEHVLPMLTEGKMLPPDKLAVLQSDVEKVLAAYKGKEAVTMVHRLVVAALAAGPATARTANR